MRLAIPIIIMISGMLAGCTAAQPAKVQVGLPPIPADIRACADRHVPRPAGAAPLTERQLYRLIADLKASEAAKGGCLTRLVALYETQAQIVREALR